MAGIVPRLRGEYWILYLFDVCDEIRLSDLRALLGSCPAGREPAFRGPTPEYATFRKQPVIEELEALRLESGEQFTRRIHYHEYGVVSLQLRLAFDFQFDWRELVRLSSRWMAAPEMEKEAMSTVRQHLERARPALIKPYDEWLSEDYCIIQVDPVERGGEIITGEQSVEEWGAEMAQIVRGETMRLSDHERAQVLQTRRSYYPEDLIVIGWSAALIYDTPEGALPAIQLLEYANAQLIEFRHYDGVLTGLLSDVYGSLEKGRGVLSRWRMAREAERLNTIRLDVRELTERMDNSIKFLSDMFSARIYRLSAGQVGVNDYRRLVDDELRTAGDLYQFMMDQFQHARAFVLELLVVIILVIELVFLFKGK